MIRVLFLILFLSCDDVKSSENKSDTNQTDLYFHIEMLDEREYGMEIIDGEYRINISPSSQSIFKMKCYTDSNLSSERITWSTNKNYQWSNGIVEDYYPLINPSSYVNSEGIGYSMIGFMPEMKGSSVIIYGKYYNLVDSVIVHIQ